MFVLLRGAKVVESGGQSDKVWLEVEVGGGMKRGGNRLLIVIWVAVFGNARFYSFASHAESLAANDLLAKR